MTKFTTFQHSATAMVAALLLSTTFVSAAVGPAAAVERSPVDTVAVQLPTSAQVQA